MSFSVINCTRLLLNIRRAYYFGSDDDESGLVSWSAIAGGENNNASRALTLPRRHCRERSSYDFPGEIQVAVDVAIEVEVNSTSLSSGSFSNHREGEYELSEISAISR
jgi:hypothetical protein